MTSTKSSLQSLFAAIAESAKRVDTSGPLGDEDHTVILIPKEGAPHVIPTNFRFMHGNMFDIVTYYEKTYRFSLEASRILGGKTSVFREARVCDLTDRDFFPAGEAQIDKPGDTEGAAAAE